MYSLVRKFIFSMQPESAHEFTIKALKMAGKLPFPIFPTPDNPVEVMGLKFKNPIGLAAGADKNGEVLVLLRWARLHHWRRMAILNHASSEF